MSDDKKRKELLRELESLVGDTPEGELNFNAAQAYVDKDKIGNISGTIRAVGQGASFGFGDEAEAYVKSLYNKKTYDENLKIARDKLEKFKQQNPLAAYGGEIAGSLVSSLGGVGLAGKGIQAASKINAASKAGKAGVNLAKSVDKLGDVGKTMLTAGTEGAVYGAGASEEGERLRGAGIGAATGTIGGGVFSKLLPSSTNAAKELMKKGVKPTAFQAYGGGVAGSLGKGFEETVTSIIGLGPSVSQARARGLSQFNKLAMTEALKPALSKNELNVLVKELDDMHGQEAFNHIQKVIGNKYDDTLERLSIPETGINQLENVFEDILGKQYDDIISQADSKVANKMFMKALRRNVKDINGQEVLKGKNLKQLQVDIRNMADQFYKKGGTDANIGEAFQQLGKEFKNIVRQENPKSKLFNIDKAYAGLVPIREAVASAHRTKGIFTTEQFLNAIKKSDKSVGKSMTARGKNIFGNLPELGQEVLGNVVPDTGTASRLVSSNLLDTGGKDIVKHLYQTAIGDVVYSSPVQALGRGLLSAGQPALRYNLPYASGKVSGILTGDQSQTEEERLLQLLK